MRGCWTYNACHVVLKLNFFFGKVNSMFLVITVNPYEFPLHFSKVIQLPAAGDKIMNIYLDCRLEGRVLVEKFG